MFGKTDLEIPEVLQQNLQNISSFERFTLTKRFEKAISENSKLKIKNKHKLIKIRASNLLSGVLRENVFDTSYLSRAREKFVYVEQAVNAIQALDFEKLSVEQQNRMSVLVSKLVKNIESALELSGISDSS